MANRDTILASLKANKPKLIDLPFIDAAVFDEQLDLAAEFTKILEVVGGNVVAVSNDDEIASHLQNSFSELPIKYSTIDESYGSIDLETIANPKDLENLDVLVLESTIAVAENGAIWLADKNLPIRVLPFITKHLAIIISKKDIVPYMHQAYTKLNNTESDDYGVFISGPSKTADIEQSLVIGAHGALSLTVYLKG
ncbi:LutC/YkgG family protein [Seonamhaeicola maritimus]|uniref:Lactate utilization protein B/C n=1 Tax=Seonamhaeicola maritimus TaxID=2591822 RepID=A0A5C7GLU3_9FLAO|nr:LUD domain-containing protein [Seonamhaeicola maritimus]TXG39017.1 lactate utilization protein B/C [Seonamhaeicola maritimus]